MYPCFRNGVSLPPLGPLVSTHNLGQKFRIRCRDKFSNPDTFLEVILRNERKIERVLRSKSNLDSLFELVPMSPWRQTTALQLDFKNFYPSILCSTPFPHPAQLAFTETRTIPKEPGIVRCLLHPTDRTPETLKHVHPFQIQDGKKNCPFQIAGPIETLLHTIEIPIWGTWFDIEPREAILSQKGVPHPLKNRTIEALQNLEELRNDPTADDSHIHALKVAINSASTTPKIGGDKWAPSPFGVHCLPSQIVSLGKALLCQTIQLCLQADPENEVLQINTDGFHLASKNPDATLTALAAEGILGNDPGQLREKSRSEAGFFLGTNTWWTWTGTTLTASAGTGIPHTDPKPIPLAIKYTHKGEQHKIPLIHLADFHHKLDHNTLRRQKFLLPENPDKRTPFLFTETERNRSFQKTLREFRNFRKAFQNPTG